jgi:hypothetical protein
LRLDAPVRTLALLSFRDDHDAAISRIDALERELADAREHAREKSARDDRRIAMLERELADLRRTGNAPRRKSAPQPIAAPLIDELDTRPLAGEGPPISKVLLAALVALGIGAATLALYIARDDRRPPKTECTINSVRDQAQVYGLDGDREVNLGRTPVRMRFDEWAGWPRIQLRLDGHESLTIPVPTDESSCDEHHYELERK